MTLDSEESGQHLNSNIYFPIGKSLDLDGTQIHAKIAGHLLCKCLRKPQEWDSVSSLLD